MPWYKLDQGLTDLRYLRGETSTSPENRRSWSWHLLTRHWVPAQGPPKAQGPPLPHRYRHFAVEIPEVRVRRGIAVADQMVAGGAHERYGVVSPLAAQYVPYRRRRPAHGWRATPGPHGVRAGFPTMCEVRAYLV